MTVITPSELIAIPLTRATLPDGEEYTGFSLDEHITQYVARARTDLSQVIGIMSVAGLDNGGLSIAPEWAVRQEGRDGGFELGSADTSDDSKATDRLTIARKAIRDYAAEADVIMQLPDVLLIWGSTAMWLFGDMTPYEIHGQYRDA